MKIKLEKIDEYNFWFAVKLQWDIFSYEPDCCPFFDYLDTVLGNSAAKHFIVKDKTLDKYVGVTGFYESKNFYDVNSSFVNSIWLSWFGVKKEYRKMGYGLKILKETEKEINRINLQKQTYSYFRVYYDNVEEAEPLYKKFFSLKEEYKYNRECINKKPLFIYSKVLNPTHNSVEFWNDKIFCDEYDERCIISSIILEKILNYPLYEFTEE